MPPVTLIAATPWRCPSCRHAIRPFTTSSPHRETRPESPRYIEVPQPPQQSRPIRPRIRGTLPVPRDLFTRRQGGVDKVTPDYLIAATQESANQPTIDSQSPSASYRDWKQRMAERRRQNFREGLTQLQARRRRADRFLLARSLDKQRRREEAADAPERDDVRLTKPTTTASMITARPLRGVLPDPNREARIAAMKANVKALEERRSEERQRALHTLYMHARHFITTETQLDEALEKQFGTENRPAVFGFRGTSLWNSKLPETMQDKLQKAGGDRQTDEDTSSQSNLTDRRLRKIAEELTGGGM